VKLQVLERVILRVHRLAVLGRIVGEAVRKREARQPAVVLQAQIEMPPPRGVLVDDEAMAVAWGRVAGRRLASAL
jgi:hypothetical protein